MSAMTTDRLEKRLVAIRYGATLSAQDVVDETVRRAQGMASLLCLAADNAAFRGDELLLPDVANLAASIRDELAAALAALEALHHDSQGARPNERKA
ncbi:hypothetical protein EWI61_00100 [Methylolobus aquaticus]|nr:hypothetical protein EWI61_00100 [Methylolobus aquaticus]